MDEAKNFFGGIPTGADVNLIMAKYPKETLTPGFRIPYIDIARIIQTDERSNRFRGVTSAWRKRLEKESNIVINPDDQDGFTFKVLSEPEKVKFSRKKLKTAGRMSVRSLKISAMVDIAKLSLEDREEHGRNTKRAGMMLSVGQLRKNQSPLPEL